MLEARSTTAHSRAIRRSPSCASSANCEWVVGGGVDGEAARVADIGDVVEQFERVDEFPARDGASRQFEAEQRAIAALEIFVGGGRGFSPVWTEGWITLTISGRFASHAATAVAFWQWRSMRRAGFQGPAG